jgi:glycosyltransferase involved in cell wall biosynthesis
MPKDIILYVGGFILPDGNAAAHRVLSNAKILRKLGFKVNLLGVTKRSSHKKLNLIESKKNHQGFNCYEISYPSSNLDWILYLSSINDLKLLAQSVGLNDIHSIIVYNYPSIALCKLIRYCKKNKIKIIADSTEWYSVEDGSLLFRMAKLADNYFRMKYLHYKCNGIICISKFLFNFYKTHKATLLLPPLVDLDEEKWFSKYPSPGSVKEFTFVGSSNRPGEKESFDNILMAFSRIAKEFNFYFNIVGISEDEIRNNSKVPAINLEELGNNIVFWGILENRECIRLINKSHFFIFFRFDTITTKAGFPTKFVESISAGSPVLTNKTSNIEDYLITGKNGFWIDVDTIQSQLESCLKMSIDEINAMKDYCLETKRFHFANYINEFESFMSKM